MKTTQDHHSNKLSSSVAFKPEEDGRRTKKTYIVLSSWPVLPRTKCRLLNDGTGLADAPFLFTGFSLQNLGRGGPIYSLRPRVKEILCC